MQDITTLGILLEYAQSNLSLISIFFAGEKFIVIGLFVRHPESFWPVQFGHGSLFFAGLVFLENQHKAGIRHRLDPVIPEEHGYFFSEIHNLL